MENKRQDSHLPCKGADTFDSLRWIGR